MPIIPCLCSRAIDEEEEADELDNGVQDGINRMCKQDMPLVIADWNA